MAATLNAFTQKSNQILSDKIDVFFFLSGHDAQGGAPLWDLPLDEFSQVSGIQEAAHGILVFGAGSMRGRIEKRDPRTGSLVWTLETPFSPFMVRSIPQGLLVAETGLNERGHAIGVQIALYPAASAAFFLGNGSSE